MSKWLGRIFLAASQSSIRMLWVVKKIYCLCIHFANLCPIRVLGNLFTGDGSAGNTHQNPFQNDEHQKCMMQMGAVTFWVPGHILIHSPILNLQLLSFDLLGFGFVSLPIRQRFQKNALATKGRFVVDGNDGRKHSYLSTKTKLYRHSLNWSTADQSYQYISLRHRTDGYYLGRYQIRERWIFEKF